MTLIFKKLPIMKKVIFVSLAAIAAVFNFSSCQKDETFAPKEDVKANFSIYTGIDTKTTIDSFSTKWTAGDSINVFHATNGTTAYSSNDKFSIAEADLSTGRFTGTLSSSLAAANDWYALYPYNSDINTPSNPAAGSVYIGCADSHTTAQTQNGNNSTAHLAGQYFPLYAQAKNVASDASVSLNFKPIASILKIAVKNETNEDLTVSDISFSAKNEDVIGSYYIDFAGTEPVLTPSGDAYVSNSTTLKVANGTAIASGKTGEFYLAIKPFSTSEDDTLTFTVNGLEKITDEPFTFKAGKVKTVNFSYDKKISSYVLSFPDDNSANNKVNNYTSDWTAKIGEKEWTISQFNNSNWTGWTYIKAGRRTAGATTTPYIKTNAAFKEAINCVAISYGACSNLDKISNAKLIVASDADFTQDVKEYSLTITSATEVKCNITPTANRYYKISYNCGVGTSNGYLFINKVSYIY